MQQLWNDYKPVCTTTKIYLNRKEVEECEENCHMVKDLSTATYKGYWCVAATEIPSKIGYLFGGLFTASQVNPVTGVHTCPFL